MPTALSRSHATGDPFFTITQNALADGTYLEYIRATFRYVNLLITDKRLNDARSIGLTARACDPENQQFEGLVTELDRMRRAEQSQ